MNGREFYNRITNHALLEYLGAAPARKPIEGRPGEPDRAYFRRRDTGIKWELPFTSIAAHPWAEIEDLLLGRRTARVLTHVARVVGYYSFTHNWSKSKIAELADRQRGEYTVPDKTEILDAELSSEVVAVLAEDGAEIICDLSKKGSC